MADKLEAFTCGTCGYQVIVNWKDGDDKTYREIPCGGCYYETWVRTDIAWDKNSWATSYTTKTISGAIIICEKNAGTKVK